jgi:hypothetical protein
VQGLHPEAQALPQLRILISTASQVVREGGRTPGRGQRLNALPERSKVVSSVKSGRVVIDPPKPVFFSLSIVRLGVRATRGDPF